MANAPTTPDPPLPDDESSPSGNEPSFENNHSGSSDPRVDAGIGHLQTAAMELIGAARAFLDVVEDLVSDDDKVHDMVAAVGAVAEQAARGVEHSGLDAGSLMAGLGDLAGRFGLDGSRRPPSSGKPDPAPDGRVERIVVR